MITLEQHPHPNNKKRGTSVICYQFVVVFFTFPAFLWHSHQTAMSSLQFAFRLYLSQEVSIADCHRMRGITFSFASILILLVIVNVGGSSPQMGFILLQSAWYFNVMWNQVACLAIQNLSQSVCIDKFVLEECCSFFHPEHCIGVRRIFINKIGMMGLTASVFVAGEILMCFTHNSVLWFGIMPIVSVFFLVPWCSEFLRFTGILTQFLYRTLSFGQHPCSGHCKLNSDALFSYCLTSFETVKNLVCHHVESCFNSVRKLYYKPFDQHHRVETKCRLCPGLHVLTRNAPCTNHLFVHKTGSYRICLTQCLSRVFFTLHCYHVSLCSFACWNHLQWHSPTTVPQVFVQTFPALSQLSFSARPLKWNSRFVLLYSSFDSTLGFPGEGPSIEPTSWKCISANIDSIQSNIDYQSWDHDVCFLQETRLTNLNFNANLHTVKQFGKHIFSGDLLNEKADKNGIYKSPHGGCAILAPQATTRAFDSKDDTTGLWNALHRSTRVCAVWHQIAKNVRALCITLYGHSGVNENNNLEINDNIIDNIFTLCSQFGDIPIIFSGDFQADPDQYQSVVRAKQTGLWFDPLVSCDSDGTTHRPITYSRNSNFLNPTEYFSSIDAMMVNSVALAALKLMRVCHECCRPHAPIEAIFEWDKLYQTGFVLKKPAAFDFASIAKVGEKIDHELLQQTAENIWQTKYATRFSASTDEKAWKYINNLGKETLIAAGAKFGYGPKTRGHDPVFEKKKVFPGQTLEGSVCTNKSAKLAKVNKLVTELRFRYQRESFKTEDSINTYNLQNRVIKAIQDIPECNWWSPELHCCEEGIIQVQKCLQKAIVNNCQREKRQRIHSWKLKMINGTRSKNVSKYIYKWFKNKTQVHVPNLIRNVNGDILYSPIEAIDEINNQWDDVFSANALHNNPHDVLADIWPIVSRIRNPVTLPHLTGEMLQQQAAKRRIDAAAGIDGWRTSETKILPLKIYDLIAEYFCDVENGIRQLPGILTTARQIILHKGGEDVPLQKRLISILPIFMITYTSLRFKHLQQWQIQTLPRNLYGGIHTRKMSQLQMQFRLALDDAGRSNQSLIGVKLDKSKCFDRLLPDISCAIMLGLGIPKTAIRVFASLYGNLRRFLTYQSWTSHVSTTCANGVIQGCSFSLLAVNAHMTVWSAYMQALPGICAAAYIDDCYVWSKLENLRIFQQAMSTTNSWDTLTGQLANHRKSVAWSNTGKGRKTMKAHFPEMQHKHIVEILGASMQTTLKHSMGWDKIKTTKAIRDLKLIRALPCSRDVHSHLAGVKVIPQVAFSPHLNLIPKCDLQCIQDNVADLLWKNRPLWRSRGLVFALLANPCRVDPFSSRAFRTIAECIHFLKNCEPHDREKWKTQCNQPHRGHTVVSSFRNACDHLGLCHISEFHFTFCNSEPLCFLDFSIRELKRFLEAIARHKCYQNACKSSRKDLGKHQGILDFDLTNQGIQACKGEFRNGLDLKCFRDSSVVGCTPTNDRRSKAGTSDTNLCRYCHAEVETLDHLIHRCQHVANDANKPTCPDNKGPNFQLLGIVEITEDLVRKRLQCSDTLSIQVTTWSESDTTVSRVWTDGSCIRPQFYWHTLGGFAVVDEFGGCLHSGKVHHVSLSSYTCELWAVIVAFCTASNPIIISSDNETVVNQTKYMIRHLSINVAWQHLQWWTFFLSVFQMRKANCDQPIQIRWIPAHLLEELPCELISNQAAIKAGSTWLDIYCNRKADAFAKRCVCLDAQTDDTFVNQNVLIQKWQKWLAILNSQLSQTCDMPSNQHNPCDEIGASIDSIPRTTTHPHEISIQHPIADFIRLLPKWIWMPNPNDFQWCSEFPKDQQLQSYANITEANWKIAVDFITSLKWVEGEQFETAYIELAFYFWFLGNRFHDVPQTPQSYCKVLRKVTNQAIKMLPNCPFVPGTQHSKCKCKGRVLPAGSIIHCYPYIDPGALKHLAVHVLHGRSQALSAWDCCF